MLSRHFLPVAAAGVLALGGAAAAAPVPGPVTARATTSDYSLELDIGPTEHMYSARQVKAQHPTAGEIMVGGRMTMAMGAGWHHLELHVLSKKTGTPVTGAKVQILVTGPASGHAVSVPIAVMYGIQAGKADWHYGNNVKMPPGKYRVDVAANGEKARFDVTIPKG